MNMDDPINPAMHDPKNMEDPINPTTYDPKNPGMVS